MGRQNNYLPEPRSVRLNLVHVNNSSVNASVLGIDPDGRINCAFAQNNAGHRAEREVKATQSNLNQFAVSNSKGCHEEDVQKSRTDRQNVLLRHNLRVTTVTCGDKYSSGLCTEVEQSTVMSSRVRY
ncbi:hypothetical protein EVAR_103190_1 [Eumeta japonica]|uniref:Uncharacterized protein n=1 Tax=Eumeta variegata TaxID=151549 RepID=A0A4C1YCI6_EUMVA|nr:hypothetical protein EVAR_103190_1 [Eumeta japonica]